MKNVNVDTLFPSLEAQAARLNAVSDHVNELLVAIEKRLLELNVGLECWYSRPIDVGDSDGDISPSSTSSKVVQKFGLSRVEGRWCLAVKPIRLVSGFYEGDMSCPYENPFSAGPVVPLLQTSRALRVAALQAIPDFLSELDEKVSATLSGIEAVAEQLGNA